jgi:hypothetical protein
MIQRRQTRVQNFSERVHQMWPNHAGSTSASAGTGRIVVDRAALFGFINLVNIVQKKEINDG